MGSPSGAPGVAGKRAVLRAPAKARAEQHFGAPRRRGLAGAGFGRRADLKNPCERFQGCAVGTAGGFAMWDPSNMFLAWLGAGPAQERGVEVENCL